MFMTGINSLKVQLHHAGVRGQIGGEIGVGFGLVHRILHLAKRLVGVTSKSNLMSMALKPCTTVDVISSMPEIVLISFSRGG
jgi:hypothetical protein